MKSCKRLVRALIMFACLAVSHSVEAVTINTVPIGNSGNLADTRYDATGFGSVDYHYRMGKTEITNAQYAEFLNAVAAADPYELWFGDGATDPQIGIVRSGVSSSFTYAVKAPAVGLGPGG